MGDPLSVAASITGLIAVAGQLYVALDGFISNVREAPSLAATIKAEINSFRNSLNALHSLLEDPGFCHSRRAALISADYVVVSFTDAVLVFSQLETNVLPLTKFTDYSIAARTQWTRKKTTLNELVGRLQWQKHTLVLQLNILRCASDIEAEHNRQALDKLICERLGKDRDMERRLELVEQQLHLQSNSSLYNRGSIISSKTRDSNNLTIRGRISGTSISANASPTENNIFQHAFEALLNNSWVYKRNQNREEDMSFRSSVPRLSAWSVLSDMSLANISIISVMCLPVQFEELANGSWYISGNPPTNSENTAPLQEAPPSNQPLSDIDEIIDEYENDDDSATTLLEDEPQAISNTVAQELSAEEHDSVIKPEDEHEDADEDKREKVESAEDTPSAEIFKTFRVSIDDPCRVVLPAALKRYNITDDWRQYALYIVHGEQERCLGLEEKPLLLFRQLDKEGRKPMFMLRKHVAPQEGWSFTNTTGWRPLPLTSGSLNTVDFVCWNCRKKVEASRYARTTNGKLCMPCYDMLMERRRKRPEPEKQEQSNVWEPDLTQSDVEFAVNRF